MSAVYYPEIAGLPMAATIDQLVRLIEHLRQERYRVTGQVTPPNWPIAILLPAADFEAVCAGVEAPPRERDVDVRSLLLRGVRIGATSLARPAVIE
jgi:hypothetical protein